MTSAVRTCTPPPRVRANDPFSTPPRNPTRQTRTTYQRGASPASPLPQERPLSRRALRMVGELRSFTESDLISEEERQGLIHFLDEVAPEGDGDILGANARRELFRIDERDVEPAGRVRTCASAPRMASR